MVNHYMIKKFEKEIIIPLAFNPLDRHNPYCTPSTWKGKATNFRPERTEIILVQISITLD